MVSASMRRLSVFKAVVDAAGVNAAALELRISQPSVTAHISALERQVGTKLFVRQRGKKLLPTRAGEALYSYANDAVLKSQEIYSVLRKADEAQALCLSVAAQRTLANNVLPPILASFLKRFPEARISMHSETQEGVTGLLRHGNADIGILFSSDEWHNFPSDIVGYQKLVFIASPKHPLAKCATVCPEQLSEYPFVAGLSESQFFGLMRDAMRKVGLHEPNVILNLQDTATVKRAVCHNIGLACTLLSAVQDELAHRELVVLPIKSEVPRLIVRCFRRATKAIAEDFSSHLGNNMLSMSN